MFHLCTVVKVRHFWSLTKDAEELVCGFVTSRLFYLIIIIRVPQKD